MDRLDRRRLLQLGGAVGAAALAGCSGGGDDNESTDSNESANGNESDGGNGTGESANGDESDDEGNGEEDTDDEDTDDENGGESEDAPETEIDENATLEAGAVPAYADFAPASASDLFYGDVAALQGQSYEPAAVDSVPLALASQAVDTVGRLPSLALGTFGLGRLFVPDNEFATTIDETVFSGSVAVLQGSIDAAEIGEQVQTTRDAPFPQVALEPDGDFGAYAVYAAPEGSDDLPTLRGESVDTVAVNETAVVVGPRAGVEHAIETARGDRARATDDSPPLAWLVSTGSDADLAGSRYDPDGLGAVDFDDTGVTAEDAAAIADATGRATSVTFDGDTVEIRVALVFGETTSTEQRAALADLPGANATAASLAIDDERALLAVTYDEGFVTE
jgi:hypothetical protein